MNVYVVVYLDQKLYPNSLSFLEQHEADQEQKELSEAGMIAEIVKVNIPTAIFPKNVEVDYPRQTYKDADNAVDGMIKSETIWLGIYKDDSCHMYFPCISDVVPDQTKVRGYELVREELRNEFTEEWNVRP